jgi:long-chain acyl-CoA synthetase
VLAYEIWFDALPRTTSQAIERHEVERRVLARREAAHLDPPLTPAEQTWLDQPHVTFALSVIQQRVRSGVRVRPEWNLELDVGLDSMDRVELIAELEQTFGTRLSTPSEIFTVRQLVEAVAIDRPEAVSPQDAPRPWAAILRDPQPLNWLLRKRIVAPLLWLIVRVARRLLVRVKVNGLDKLPLSGPYIISPNHQSYVDPFILCSVLPYRVFKDIFLVGAVEYFETPLTRWVARTVNLVPVDPDSNLVPAMRAAAFGLTHGRILLLFPEGERSIDGTVKRFKKGAAILAQHLRVPIVPVALRGIHEMWPRNRGINWALVAPWSRHRVSIEIGEPVTLPETASYDDSAAGLRSRVNEMWEALST